MEKSRDQARIKREAVQERLIRLGCRPGDGVVVGDGYLNARDFCVTSNGLAQMEQTPPFYDYQSTPMDDETYEFVYKALILGRGHVWIKGKQIV